MNIAGRQRPGRETRQGAGFPAPRPASHVVRIAGYGSGRSAGRQPQGRLSQVFAGTPPFYATGDGSTGAISLLVQFDIQQGYQQVAGVEFDSTALINFRQGVMFYGSSGNISPGVPVPGTSNFLSATLFLGVGAGNQTLGTVVILEAVG